MKTSSKKNYYALTSNSKHPGTPRKTIDVTHESRLRLDSYYFLLVIGFKGDIQLSGSGDDDVYRLVDFVSR